MLQLEISQGNNYICIYATKAKYRTNFIIDKLTNSIENTISGDSFQTEISVLTKANLKTILKKEWLEFQLEK